jgi:hypothetical protein
LHECGDACERNARVGDLQPRDALAVRQHAALGDDAGCALLDRRFDKLVPVNRRPFNRDEQPAVADLPRIVRHVANECGRVARESCAGCACDFSECVVCYRLLVIHL